MKSQPLSMLPFPSLPIQPQHALMVVMHVLQTQLLPQALPFQRRSWLQLLRELQRLEQPLSKHRGILFSDQPRHGIAPPEQYASSTQWGQQLSQRRQEAGLSRRELGLLCDVSESTVASLERGRSQPTRVQLMRLQSLPLLCQPVAETDSTHPHDAMTQSAGAAALLRLAASTSGCIFSSENDVYKAAQVLLRQYDHSPGYIDPSMLYPDAESAASLCAVTAQPAMQELQQLMPLYSLAQALQQSCAQLPLDFIGLGCGQAISEVRLLQHLLPLTSTAPRLLLLDLNQSLLIRAFHHAAETFAHRPDVRILAVQDDVLALSRYSALWASPLRRRVACLFGHTFAQLQDEQAFLHQSLSVLARGDLLVLHVPMALASASQQELLLQLEPDLASPLLAHWQHNQLQAARDPRSQLLLGPIVRYVSQLRSVALSCQLVTEPLSAFSSYGLQFRAHVRTMHRRKYSIRLGAPYKRYQPTQLARAMAQQHWQLLQTWRYSCSPTPQLLLLFQKLH